MVLHHYCTTATIASTNTIGDSAPFTINAFQYYLPLLLSHLNMRTYIGLEQNPKNHCLGVFQGALEGTLWSEYPTTTNFHVGKKKFARPPILSETVQNLSFRF